MTAQWTAYIERARAQWGERLSLDAIPERFLPYFGTGRRIKVRMYGEEITGTVGVTGGWEPSLLLIRRAGSSGSSDVINHFTELVAVQYGRVYQPVSHIGMIGSPTHQEYVKRGACPLCTLADLSKI